MVDDGKGTFCLETQLKLSELDAKHYKWEADYRKRECDRLKVTNARLRESADLFKRLNDDLHKILSEADTLSKETLAYTKLLEKALFDSGDVPQRVKDEIGRIVALKDKLEGEDESSKSQDM